MDDLESLGGLGKVADVKMNDVHLERLVGEVSDGAGGKLACIGDAKAGGHAAMGLRVTVDPMALEERH